MQLSTGGVDVAYKIKAQASHCTCMNRCPAYLSTLSMLPRWQDGLLREQQASSDRWEERCCAAEADAAAVHEALQGARAAIGSQGADLQEAAEQASCTCCVLSGGLCRFSRSTKEAV